MPLLWESPVRCFERAASLSVDKIWVDALNPRPKVWPAVSDLLRRKFPHLRRDYGAMLYEKEARKAYLAALRHRVSRAADRCGLADRLAHCP